ncbi:hypothetical protein B0T10DRAFT_556974 [Thelonectria olida]|uniref:Cyclin-like F-box n=1 Tax=Thelonectria olida TaxID=1576542 RepID=A0A9P8WEK9_9HYPO|nr:hypothetical protein B0T10DRAFT_556974 [Thelonectria olida]
MAANSVLDATAVTYLDGPFELVPVIRDILRTHYCVPGTVFLVEGLDQISVSRSGRWQTVRLLLGDGALCVQALLAGSIHRLVQTGEVAMGSYVRCEDFEVKWKQTDNGAMVYLVIEDFVAVGWNESYRRLKPAMTEEALPEKAPDKDRDEDEDDQFEGFETMTHPVRQTPKETPKLPDQPIALARDWHDPQSPLKLTTLRSIAHLPYAQNWSCNVLAIVTSLSPVEPSNLAPHKQRTARLADPSTSKQIHLTVFLDPDEFSPRVGSAVLLVGVKNHRFDGGSLKKYASDRHQDRWWFENPVELNWCDINGIKEWWAQMADTK